MYLRWPRKEPERTRFSKNKKDAPRLFRCAFIRRGIAAFARGNEESRVVNAQIR